MTTIATTRRQVADWYEIHTSRGQYTERMDRATARARATLFRLTFADTSGYWCRVVHVTRYRVGR